jgi:hypothetical protein
MGIQLMILTLKNNKRNKRVHFDKNKTHQKKELVAKETKIVLY